MWQHATTGQIYVWFMDGTTQVSGAYCTQQPASPYKLSAVGDLDGDSKPDLIFTQPSTGQRYAWLQDGLDTRTENYLSVPAAVGCFLSPSCQTSAIDMIEGAAGGPPSLVGSFGTIARSELDIAMASGGQTIELVTKLTQSPAAGRALSAAGGDGARALAAASRAAGNLYMARIPEHAIRLLQAAGLVETRITMMNGVRGLEYRFSADAMDYLGRYFEEVGQ